MISSIHVSLGRDYSEMLFKLMSLITQGCGRASALITSHQVAYSSTFTHMELLMGPWHRATFHKSVALPVLIPHFELPFLSSPFHPSSRCKQTQPPLLHVFFAFGSHHKKRILPVVL